MILRCTRSPCSSSGLGLSCNQQIVLPVRACRGRFVRSKTTAQQQQQQQQRRGSRGSQTTEDYPQHRGNYQSAPRPSEWRQEYAGPPNEPPPPPPNSSENSGGGWVSRNLTTALIAGAFIMGMGAGVLFNSEVTFHPSNVASTEIIDRKTPNSEVCMANGYSSMVFDQRIFISFNPFNVYVTQPEVKPGCVLRRSNFNVLENRKLVNKSEVNSCKRNMNTFAFVGDLEKSPEVSCVYHQEEAENQFLKDPKSARFGDGNRPQPLPSSD